MNKKQISRTLNPNWIVGFVDGNGHFSVSNGHFSVFDFVVSQDQQSINVLYEIKTFFKCGSVHKAEKNMRKQAKRAFFKVSSKKHLENIIVPFFKKWPLKTSKKKCFEIFVKKLNPTLNPPSGVEGRASLGQARCQTPSNFNLDWFIGFIDAEGHFVCSIINQTIRPQFIIGLNEIDKSILDQIKQNLNFGIRYKRKNGIEVFQLSSNQNMCHFVKDVLLTKAFKDRLKTYKRIRARKWCQIVLLMEQKKHKTIEGFNKIQKLHKSF
uniref:Homing endonuclease LAGLIDADG domain-containing protein n=1 Tax=Caulerpa cliftonii TaxID=1004391 RepID=A0A1C9JBQ2_9CHLO|nr:hypothetical protein [Caulerpa cliftonii]AOP19290.1 hypothetical protein [Caulerpa cliftonii]